MMKACDCKTASSCMSKHVQRSCRIAKSEGAGALYVGIGPSLLGMVPSGAIYYWCVYSARRACQGNDQVWAVSPHDMRST